MGGTGHHQSQYTRQLRQYFTIPRVLSEGEVFAVLPNVSPLSSVLLVENERQRRLLRALELIENPNSESGGSSVVNRASLGCKCQQLPFERLKILGECGRLWRPIALLELGFMRLPTLETRDSGGRIAAWSGAVSWSSVPGKTSEKGRNSLNSTSAHVGQNMPENSNVSDLWKIWDHEVEKTDIGAPLGACFQRIDPVEGLAGVQPIFFVIESLLSSNAESPSAIVDITITSLILSQAPTFTANLIPLHAEHTLRVIPRSHPLAVEDQEWFRK